MIIDKWKPEEGLTDYLSFYSIHYDVEGFRVLLKNKDTEGAVYSFLFTPLSFRVLDEGDYLKTSYGNFKGSLYVIRNSDFVKWFAGECKGMYSPEKILHYGLYTDDECIDVLSAHPPVVKRAIWG